VYLKLGSTRGFNFLTGTPRKMEVQKKDARGPCQRRQSVLLDMRRQDSPMRATGGSGGGVSKTQHPRVRVEMGV